MDGTATNLVEFFTDSCDTVQVEEFINEGLDVNAPLSLEDGRRPLHVAATNGNVDMVEALLDRGVDVDVPDYRGNTALHYAAREGHRIVVRQLLYKEADPNLTNDERCTILQNAVCFEHVDVTRHLLSKGACLNAAVPTNSLPPCLETKNWYFREEMSLLCLAFKLGNLPLTRELISAGADVMAEFNVLMCIAVKGKNLELVNLLLERREDIVRFVNWKRILDVAISGGWYRLVEMFLDIEVVTEKRSFQEALQEALRGGHLEIAKLLTERGAELSVELVNSSLKNALSNGHTDVAEWLFRQEPQELPSQREYMNYLVEAIRNENIGIIRLIVDRLDNIDARTTEIRYPENTALIYATQRKLLPAIELLLEKGADEARCDAFGRTALFYAIQNDSYLDIFKVFEKYRGLSVNTLVDTSSESTALHQAAAYCRSDLVEYLLQKGANVNATDKNGNTPFHRLLQNVDKCNYLHLIKQFVDKGADLYHANKDSFMPLDLVMRDKYRLHKESPEVDLERFFVEECFQIEKGHFQTIYLLFFQIIKFQQMSLMKLVLQKIIGFYYKEKVLYRDAPNTIVRSEIPERLIEYEDSGINLLHCAAFKGDERLSDTALRNGVDIDALTKEGFTALQIALYKGNTELAQYLISKGAKVSIVDGLELLPFHVALLSGYDTLVTQLFFETCLRNSSLSLFEVPFLHWAAYKGNVSSVKFLLLKGFNINTKDQRGNTMLHIAVKTQNCELGDFLMEKGIDKNAQDANGDTALHLASRQVLHCGMSLEIPQSLLRHDVDVDITNNHGETVLHSAASTPLASAILAKGVRDINVLGKGGTSPLHCLATFLQRKKEITFDVTDQVIWFLKHDPNVAKKSILIQLLESKWVDIKRVGEHCDVNFALIVTYNDISKVFENFSFSNQKRKYDIMEVLLSQGFTLNEKKEFLHHVMREENTDLFKLVLEKDRQLDLQVVLSIVIREKKYHLIKLLLDKIDVNNTDNFDASIFIPDEGMKPGLVQRYLDRLIRFKETLKTCDLLVRVVKAGYTSIAKILLDKGAYINAVDAQSNTALHYAAASINKQFFHLLLSKGAHVEHFNKKNETPIHFAAKAGNYDAFKALLDLGGNPQTTDVDGNTLIHKTKSLNIARKLINIGVQVHARNSSGRTALHCIVALKNDGTQLDDEASETAAFLIYAGVKVNEQDSAGMAPLHLAAKNNHLKTTTVLIEHEAKIDLMDQRKQTALHHAVSNLNYTIVKYLLSEGALSHVIDEDGCSPHSLCRSNQTIRISNRTIRNLFIKLSLKEELAGLPSEELSGMQLNREENTSCLEELELLKVIFVHETFSLFEIFSSYQKPLYLFDEQLIQSIERFFSSMILMSQFPHYRGILKRAFKRSKRSRCYMTHQAMKSILLLKKRDKFLRTLPLVFIYLRVQDLHNIVTITTDIDRASKIEK